MPSRTALFPFSSLLKEIKKKIQKNLSIFLRFLRHSCSLSFVLSLSQFTFCRHQKAETCSRDIELSLSCAHCLLAAAVDVNDDELNSILKRWFVMKK